MKLKIKRRKSAIPSLTFVSYLGAYLYIYIIGKGEIMIKLGVHEFLLTKNIIDAIV